MSDANDIELDADERRLFQERALRLRDHDVPSWEELEACMAEPAPRSYAGIGIAAIVAAAAALAISFGLSVPRRPTPLPAPTAVAPATPERGFAFRAAGFVVAKTPISLSTPSGGVVKEVKAQEGDKITKGQLLVQLDDTAARAELIAAQAELPSAEARYATMTRLTRAGAAMPTDVARARGELAVAQAKLESIRARVAAAKIRSPIDGVVLERLAAPGETVAARSALIRIADLTELAVEVDVVEADRGKIYLGQSVEVTPDAAGDRRYDGKVYEIAAEVDSSRGTVRTKVALRVPDLSLRPDSSVRCAFQLPQR